MKIYSTIGAAILSALSFQAMAGTIAIQELSTTTETGDYPVCFNGAGELLPCADGVEPPPGDEPPYIGYWSGRIVYDRDYIGDDVCYDADVTMRVIPAISSYDRIDTITVKRDAGGIDIVNTSMIILYVSGYLNSSYPPFGIYTDFTLQFNNKGYAEGAWLERDYDCYGTWSFTKD